MRTHTGIKPVGNGTNYYEKENKKYKINYCETCIHNVGGFPPCNANAPKEYMKIRYNEMKGFECAFFAKK